MNINLKPWGDPAQCAGGTDAAAPTEYSSSHPQLAGIYVLGLRLIGLARSSLGNDARPGQYFGAESAPARCRPNTRRKLRWNWLSSPTPGEDVAGQSDLLRLKTADRVGADRAEFKQGAQPVAVLDPLTVRQTGSGM